MKVHKDWWKNFFGQTYLITDARSVCNPTLTRKEVTLLEESLNLDKDHRILDLCGGQGRHSLELARRGYKNLTVLDYSPYLIKQGKMQTKNEGRKIKFVRRDARSTGLKEQDFEAIFIMANSFGYFVRQKENLRVLKEAYRLLKRQGRFLLDLADSGHVKRKLKPFSWHKASPDIMVLRQRKLKGDLVKAREVVISKKKGLIKDGSYCERLYPKNTIKGILRQVGFKKITVKDSLSLHPAKKDYGFLTNRMIVTAQKP